MLRVATTFIAYIFASIFGIFTQSLAYFTHDYMDDIAPFYFVVIFTVLSVILFIFSIVYYFVACRKQLPFEEDVIGFFMIVGATLISCWSIFVCMMWWG